MRTKTNRHPLSSRYLSSAVLFVAPCAVLLAVAACGSSEANPTLAPEHPDASEPPDATAASPDAGADAKYATADAGADASVDDTAVRTTIASGSKHTCVVLDDQDVKCWGANFSAQLGLGTSPRGTLPGQMGDKMPIVELGGQHVLSVATGHDFSCALLDDHRVKCWGSGGLLGLGDEDTRGISIGGLNGLPTVDLGSGRTVRSIVAGHTHTCAILDDSTLKCWGANLSGQIGLSDNVRGDAPGEMGDALPAVNLGSGHTALAVAAGANHTCAILDDHTVKCWGDGLYGELGLGDKKARGKNPGEMGDALPVVDLGPNRTAIAVSAGSNHSCAILDDHSVKCWGWSTSGQLGIGDITTRGDDPGEMGGNLPTVDLGPGRTALSIASRHQHTCAILDDHSVKCWGDNVDGQLGIGDTADRGGKYGKMGSALPTVDLGAGRIAIAITVGEVSSCALLDDHSVKCWGGNDSGQLGRGDTTNRGDGPGEMGSALGAIDLGLQRSVLAP